MLSKEDIEHIKSTLKENKDYIFEFDDDNIKIEYIVEYIEQLETREQKLIEQLENKLKLNNRDIELAENGKLNLSSEEWAEVETENSLINEILSIAKGEN